MAPGASPCRSRVWKPPCQEPWFARGFGLGHATSNRGADHLYGLPVIDLAGVWDVARRLFPEEIVPELMDPVGNEKYKADMVVFGEHFCAVTDALGICKFSTIEEYALFPEDLAPGVAALWGRPVTGADLMAVGERIVNLSGPYNVRQGLSRRLTTPCPNGSPKSRRHSTGSRRIPPPAP